MKALTFSSFGGPHVLRYAEIDDAQAAPGAAIVETRAIGLNFADVYRRQGRYHLRGAPPYIAGYEAAGVVVNGDIEALRQAGLAIGSRVGFADSPFANAERVAVPVGHLVALPDGCSFDLAAAVLLQGLTAQYLTEDSYAVRNADTVVVHAAAGGVGLLLTQMARRRGARVIALASSPEKRAAALEAGADTAIASGEGWTLRVREALDGAGADAVYDSTGATLQDSLAVARDRGTVIFYGMAGGDPAPVDPRVLMDRSLTLVGGDLWSWLNSAAERRARAARLLDTVVQGQLQVCIAARVPLAEGRRAHELLESRGAIGKIILIP